jgi:hypothetical protein
MDRSIAGESARVASGALLTAEGETLVKLMLDGLEPDSLGIRQSPEVRAGFAE